VWFRCENTPELNPDDSCPAIKDDGSGEMIPYVFPLRGFWQGMHSIFAIPKTCRCDKCGHESTTRVCPHSSCHRAIPFGAGEVDEHIIAIVGGSGSGKSHYLAELIEHALEDLLPRDFNADVSPADDDTEKLFREQFKTPLDDNRVILSTAPEDKEVNPFIYELNFPRKNSVTRRVINKPMNIIFYDIAGELFDPARVGRLIVNKYLFHASGIIYLVNPLHIPEIKALIPAAEEVDVPDVMPDVILSFIRRRLQEYRNQEPSDKVPVPIAICLSQSDRLRDNNDVLGFDETLFEPSPDEGAFNVKDFKFIDADIQDKLSEWGGKANIICQTANNRFKTKGFFASSALGSSPTTMGTIEEKINPIRVEDPFLWLLSEIGLIPKMEG